MQNGPSRTGQERGVLNGDREGAAPSPEITISAPLRLLTRTELAEALRVSSRTVDRMLAEGDITPVVLRTKLVRFYLPDVVRQLMARALVSKRGCTRKLVPADAASRLLEQQRREK